MSRLIQSEPTARQVSGSPSSSQSSSSPAEYCCQVEEESSQSLYSEPSFAGKFSSHQGSCPCCLPWTEDDTTSGVCAWSSQHDPSEVVCTCDVPPPRPGSSCTCLVSLCVFFSFVSSRLTRLATLFHGALDLLITDCVATNSLRRFNPRVVADPSHCTVFNSLLCAVLLASHQSTVPPC